MAQKNEVVKKGKRDDTARIEAAIRKLADKGFKNRIEEAREVVKLLAMLDDRSRMRMIDELRPRYSSQQLRCMDACIRRGLLDAVHLYGPFQPVRHTHILESSEAALAALRDPETQVALPHGHKGQTFKSLPEISTRDADIAFDRDQGFLPVKTQRKRMDPAPIVETVIGRNGKAMVESVVEDGGNLCIRFADGKEYSLCKKDRDRLRAVL